MTLNMKTRAIVIKVAHKMGLLSHSSQLFRMPRMLQQAKCVYWRGRDEDVQSLLFTCTSYTLDVC